MEKFKVNIAQNKVSNNIAPIDVVICGVIRTPDLFKKSIETLNSLKKEGIVSKIIFSTWKGEIEKYPDMEDFLNKNNTIIVEDKEPENPGLGNVWNQMKSLENGLEKASHDKFVLKSRPDLFIKPDFIKFLASSLDKLKISAPLPEGNVFKYKIWVPWFELTQPFYIADECFFGHYDDIKKLVNYDSYYDKYTSTICGIVHIRRFLQPFAEKYPQLIKFVDNYKNEGLPSHTILYRMAAKISRKSKLLEGLKDKMIVQRRFRVLRKRLREDDYLDKLGEYYALVYSHFLVDSRSVDNPIEFKSHSNPTKRLQSNKLIENYSKDRISMPHMGQIYAYDSELLDDIANKRLKEDELFNKIFSSFSKFLSG